MVRLVALLTAGVPLWAQTPVINPRGLINAFSQQPAPAVVTPGGLLWVNGINLGPVDGFTAPAGDWPLQIGDPVLQVMINGRAAAIGSATPSRIVVQVPWEVAGGGGAGNIAQVVVAKGEVRSRPAFVRVAQAFPALRTKGDKGIGEAVTTGGGETVKLSATGLGTFPQDERPENGKAVAKDWPAALRAYVDGVAAKATARLSGERVGEFEIELQLPASTAEGSIVSILAGNATPANRPTLGKTAASVAYLAMPELARTVRQTRSAGVQPKLLVASAPRGDDGCYPSWVFDYVSKKVTRVEPCLIAAGQNAVAPVVILPDSDVMVSLVGPAEGTVEEGISRKVALFKAGSDQPMIVELPGAASVVAGGPSGSLLALMPGTTPNVVMIDTVTGEVREFDGQIGLGLPGGGGGGGVVVTPGGLTIDLGEGLNVVLGQPIGIGNATRAVVVGDNADVPTKAKLALIDQQNSVVGKRDFADGWLPLIPPAPAVQQPPGSGQANPALLRPRALVTFDAASRSVYVLSRKADESADGITAFAGPDLEQRTMAFPEGWFAASCTPQLAFYNAELARRLVLFASAKPEKTVLRVCGAKGFLTVNLADGAATAVPLPGIGLLNAAAAAGEINDFIYGNNTDPVATAGADTLYVLDGVVGTAFSIAAPPEVNSFTGAFPVPALSMVLALGATPQQAAGSAGIVVFDLNREQSFLLPTPDGFSGVQFVTVLQQSRKVVARGTKTGGSGSQYLVYDLETRDLVMIPNPEGVAFVGVAPMPNQGGDPPRPGGGGGGGQALQIQVASPETNTVTAAAFNDQREMVGIVLVRVP